MRISSSKFVLQLHCSNPYHRVFFSWRFLYFRAIKLWENMYHFSLKFSNRSHVNMRIYYKIDDSKTYQKHRPPSCDIRNCSYGAVTDTTFTPVTKGMFYQTRVADVLNLWFPKSDRLTSSKRYNVAVRAACSGYVLY